jgi:mono/diheme cytochrome c family protein
MAGHHGQAGDESQSSLLFARKCSSCHTIGRGKLVGPDLKGVTARREREWIQRFIRSSRTLILAGDPTASRLFAEFERQRMPDHDFSAEQLDALIDYLATATADRAPSLARTLDRATPDEVRLGFDLFVGRTRLADGAAPCSTCHGVRHPWARWPVTAATFAPELTSAYAKYGGHALAATTRRACAPNGPHPQESRVTPEESFALSAFLRDASLRRTAGAGDHGAATGSAR